MRHTTSLPRISALAVAGLALLGLAACQPVVAPSPGAPEVEAPTTTTTAPPVTTTTAAPTTTTTTAVPVAPSTPNAPAGFTYVGGDEFDGSALNGANWKAYHNTYGDGNNELACLTPNNVVVSGGTAKIVAKKQTTTCPSGVTDKYSSGFIGSREAGKYYPRYARFEVRAKVPHAQGLWPAFWLRHRNGSGVAEVDIMEYFHSQVPGKTSQTLHLDGVSNISKKATTFEAPTAAPGWHTWAVDIVPDPNGVRFTFYLDGKATHTFVDTKHAWASADANGTWDIAVNLAVGGKWTGDPDDTLGYLRDLNRCSISGTAPNGCTSTGIKRVDWSASTYEVDYVRVYKKN